MDKYTQHGEPVQCTVCSVGDCQSTRDYVEALYGRDLLGITISTRAQPSFYVSCFCHLAEIVVLIDKVLDSVIPRELNMYDSQLSIKLP